MASIKKYDTAKGIAWRVQYRSPDGKSRTKQGFRTKSEAQAWADKNAASIHNNDWIDPSAGKVTVGALGKRWLGTRTHLKPSTYRIVEQYWRVHVKPRWETTPVSAVRHSAVQEWIASIKRSPTVVRGAYSCLSQIMGMAVADGAIRKNPCVGVSMPKKNRPKKVYLTAAQLRELANECTIHGELVLLLGTSGLRFGEAVALRPMDLDPLRNRARIERNAVTVGSDSIIGSPKSGKARTVAVAAEVMTKLMTLAEGKSPDALLWSRSDGSPLRIPGHGNWLDSAVKRVMARNKREISEARKEGKPAPAQFPRVTPHGLRHVAAGLLVQSGANVKVVQRQLGHASAAMTLDTYAELFDDGLDEIVVKLGEVLESRSDAVGSSWGGVKKGG